MDCSFKFADMISESQAWHGALNRDIFESLQLTIMPSALGYLSAVIKAAHMDTKLATSPRTSPVGWSSSTGTF